jgi:ribosomal protein L37AE/L43A
MKPACSLGQWARTMWWPLLTLMVMSIVWSACVTITVGRLYYGAPLVNGRPLGLEEELPQRLVDGAYLLIAIVFLIPIAALFRWRFRWWTPVLGIVLLGSPIAIYTGCRIVEMNWYIGDGVPAEWLLAPPVGFAVGLTGGAIFDAWLGWYATRRRARRAAEVLCPGCAFDLRGTIAAGVQRCPECGAPFALVPIEPTAVATDGAVPTGVAAVRAGGPDERHGADPLVRPALSRAEPKSVERACSPWHWLRTMWWPLAALLLVAIVWPACMSVAIMRSLDVEVMFGDAPATIERELLMRSPDGLSVVCGVVLIALIAALFRWRFRWWPPVLGILVLGSPVAIISGRTIAEYLWTRHIAGVRWETLLPAPIAFAAGLVAGLILDGWLNRRARQRWARRATEVLCPGCAFDLRGAIAAGVQHCPDCGAPFALVRIDPTGGRAVGAEAGDLARQSVAPS